MQTQNNSNKDSTSASEKKTETKPAPTSRVAMTEREAQLSSVFDSCIPGGMMVQPPSTQR